MSLNKTITQSTGNDATHWQIAKVELYPRARKIELTISGWKDKAAYDVGLAPMGRYKVLIDEQVLQEQSNTTLIPAVKAMLKQAQSLSIDLIDDLSDAAEDDSDVI